MNNNIKNIIPDWDNLIAIEDIYKKEFPTIRICDNLLIYQFAFCVLRGIEDKESFKDIEIIDYNKFNSTLTIKYNDIKYYIKFTRQVESEDNQN